MHFKAENLTIPKHPRLLFLAQNLGVLWPSKSWGHFFWDTLYMSLYHDYSFDSILGYATWSHVTLVLYLCHSVTRISSAALKYRTNMYILKHHLY